MSEAQKQEPVKTKVTNLAAEELKAAEEAKTKGQQPPPKPQQQMTEEEFLANAQSNHIKFVREFNKMWNDKAMSNRARGRIMNALLAIPAEDEDVLFKSEQEKILFYLGQEALMVKFTFIQYQNQQNQKEFQARQQELWQDQEDNTADDINRETSAQSEDDNAGDYVVNYDELDGFKDIE